MSASLVLSTRVDKDREQIKRWGFGRKFNTQYDELQVNPTLHFTLTGCFTLVI